MLNIMLDGWNDLARFAQKGIVWPPLKKKEYEEILKLQSCMLTLQYLTLRDNDEQNMFFNCCKI